MPGTNNLDASTATGFGHGKNNAADDVQFDNLPGACEAKLEAAPQAPSDHERLH